MAVYNFRMRIEGYANGTVIADSKEKAKKALEEGQWDDIDIDVEDIIDIESVSKQ